MRWALLCTGLLSCSLPPTCAESCQEAGAISCDPEHYGLCIWPDAGAPVIAGASGGGSGGGNGGGSGAGGGGGGVCVPKTCAGLGKNCGPVSNGCGVMMNCGTCTTPEICGGDDFAAFTRGEIANVCGLVLTATFRYQYAGIGTGMCPGLTPTSLYVPATCSVAVTMSAAKFQALAAKYSACSVSDTGATLRLIDCTGNCTSTQTQCIGASGQPEQRILWSCVKQASAGPSSGGVTSCAWTPP